jgi:hypothetical protein
MFSIAVRVRGADDQGRPFEVPGRTVTVDRYGARIQVPRLLKPSQVIRVLNRSNQHSAEFRVVGPVSPPAEKLGEWAVECLEEKQNIWDIYFPLPEETSDARALLECRRCRTFSLQPLSLTEVEVLETAGLVSRYCTTCKVESLWGYPVKKFEMENLAYQASAASAGGSVGPLADRRRSPRSLTQVPARVRDYYGGSEVVQTENVSKDGFCFVASRKYYVGQGLLVTFPFPPSGEMREVRVHIVREQPSGSPARHVYGVRYSEPSRQ